MKEYKKQIIITSVITILPMLAGILLWGRMPDKVAVHWGMDNVANGWAGKATAVFGMPVLLLAVQLICIFVTLNDPKKQNVGPKLLKLIFWFIPIISWVCCGTIYMTAVGIKVNVGLWANLLIGIFFAALGNYMPKGKQSYTVGMKLPWTLNSAENWNRTSRFTGKLWIAGGICFLLNAFLQIGKLIFPLLILLVLIPAIYSYTLYKKGI